MVKYCKKCGAQLKENEKFCSECGNPTNPTPIITKTNTKTGMSTGKKVGIIVLVLIILFLIVAIASTPTTNNAPENTLSVSDVSIKSEGYGLYDISANIVPDKDYSYLEMQVIFYDADGAIIEKSPLAWNINDAKSGQTIKASGSAYCQNTPAKAEVQIFDSVIDSDSEDAIYTTEVNF